MRIYITSVLVDDQAKALDFYTEKLGFIVKHDIPMGDHRWLTVVSKEAPEGTELLLEPSEHPAAGPFKSALVNDGIPAASFKVDDLPVFETRVSPHPPLGLVIWIDNQYAAFTPEGKIGFGVLENPEPAWLEIKDIELA